MEIFKIEQTDTPLGPQCVVVWPPFYWPLLLFIPFFMFFAWRGVRAVHSLIFARFVPEGALIVLGFCGVWLFMVSVLVAALFGKTRLVLDKDGITSIWTCFSFKSEKRIDLADIHHFEKRIVHGRKGTRSYCFQVVFNDDRNAYLFWNNSAKEQELDALCDQLNVFLEKLNMVIEN